jgi:membrane protease YdiL (CAAX protease family)
MLTILKLIIYYFIYQLGFGAVATLISTSIVPMDIATMTSLAMVASTLAMAWHLIHFKYVDLGRDRCRTLSWQVLFVSALFVMAATYVLNVVIEQAGVPNTMEETFIAMSNNPFGFVTIALLAPVLEELLFRGAIEGRLLQQWTNPWVGIMVSSLIFGVVHMNPAQIPFAFLLGTMFGWLYYRTGSLLPGIIGHVLNNSVAAVNMMLYGNATIEEQIENPLTMWIWAVVAIVGFCIAALWLNKNLRKQ